jgi:hypothetical protein
MFWHFVYFWITTGIFVLICLARQRRVNNDKMDWLDWIVGFVLAVLVWPWLVWNHITQKGM